MVLHNSVWYLPFEFSMHYHSHVASSLFKNFLPYSNSLKYPGALMTELSVTKGYSSFVSFFAYFALLLFTLKWTDFDSLSSKEHVLTITPFDSLPSTLILFDFLPYKEQTCELGIICVLISELFIFLHVIPLRYYRANTHILSRNTLFNISC